MSQKGLDNLDGCYIQAGKIKLYTRIIGEGKPCVLLHGTFVDGLFWEEQINALSQEFKVIVPDLRGHGLSDKPLEGYSSEVMAMDVRNLLTKLNIKRVYLVGHSMGSRIALQFVLDYPKLVEKLVLASSGAGLIPPRKNIFPKHIQKEIGFGTPHFDLRKFNYYEILFSFANPIPEQVNKIVEQIHNTPTWLKKSMAKNAPKDYRAKLPQIQVPTLVMIGEKDTICSVEEATEIVKLISKAQLEIIPDSGHCLPIEKPNEFNTKVISFLKNNQ